MFVGAVAAPGDVMVAVACDGTPDDVPKLLVAITTDRTIFPSCDTVSENVDDVAAPMSDHEIVTGSEDCHLYVNVEVGSFHEPVLEVSNCNSTGEPVTTGALLLTGGAPVAFPWSRYTIWAPFAAACDADSDKLTLPACDTILYDAAI